MSDFTTTIKSVKLGDEIEIAAFQTHQAMDDRIDLSLKSADDPKPELPVNFGLLVKEVRRLLRLPDSWAPDTLEVTKVVWSLSEKTGVRGATICCQAKLDCADAPFVFNTPALAFEQYSEGGNAPLMPESTIAVLNEIEKAALAYLEGKRAQGDLFEGLKDGSIRIAPADRPN